MKKTIYQCKYCRLKYKEEKWHKKCEEWCKKYKTCHIEIIKHAVEDKK